MNFIDIENLHIIDNNGISVIIPLYNGIEFLEKSMLSVIRQTYKTWQLVVGINGHSNDSDVLREAHAIANRLNNENKYDILIKHYDTSGKSKTMNAMVADCKYDRIAILDVDDYWADDKLEKQVPYLNDYDVVGAKCEYFEGKEGSPPIPLGDFTNTHNIFSYNPIINSSAIIRKNDAIWDDERYVRDVGLDDYSLWFKLFYFKRKFYNVNEVLCYHRVHKQSAFNNTNNGNVDELKQLWYDYYKSH